MKLFLYPILFVCSLFYAQNKPKTDTIFSGKYNFDKIDHSKIKDLTINLKSKCVTKEISINRSKNLEYNLEYSILSTLNEFNKFSKSTVFSDYKCFIYTKFCFNCDFFDDITVIEFHYNQKEKSEIFKKKIETIINDKEFFNYPNEKLFHYKITKNNICYLLISTKDNPNNEIFNEIKSRIEKIE